jgi:hypothetical protein
VVAAPVFGLPIWPELELHTSACRAGWWHHEGSVYISSVSTRSSSHITLCWPLLDRTNPTTFTFPFPATSPETQASTTSSPWSNHYYLLPPAILDLAYPLSPPSSLDDSNTGIHLCDVKIQRVLRARPD